MQYTMPKGEQQQRTVLARATGSAYPPLSYLNFVRKKGFVKFSPGIFAPPKRLFNIFRVPHKTRPVKVKH